MYNNSNFEYVGNTNKKLLYVTVFVAALFVAVLSGTFAYFTASATNANAITGTIADVGITLSVTKMTSQDGPAINGTTLIPFDIISSGGTLNTSILTTANTGAFPNGCIDNSGYTACDIFKIAIKANSQISVNGYLRVEPGTDSNIPNVKWVLLGPRTTSSPTYIEGLSTSSIYNTTSYLTASRVVGVTTNGTDTLFTGVNAADQQITTSNSYFYVMVWLEDTGELQDDQGTYKGTVTFTGQGNNNGQVTANFG